MILWSILWQRWNYSAMMKLWYLLNNLIIAGSLYEPSHAVTLSQNKHTMIWKPDHHHVFCQENKMLIENWMSLLFVSPWYYAEVCLTTYSTQHWYHSLIITEWLSLGQFRTPLVITIRIMPYHRHFIHHANCCCCQQVTICCVLRMRDNHTAISTLVESNLTSQDELVILSAQSYHRWFNYELSNIVVLWWSNNTTNTTIQQRTK